MNTTVDFETARQLRDAGFPQVESEPTFGQVFFVGNTPMQFQRSRRYDKEECADSFVSYEFLKLKKSPEGEFVLCELWEIHLPRAIYAPTALEIIEQMPDITSIHKNSMTEWVVSFPLPGFQHDFRFDTCPHRAAAKAFIAWKKGKE